jgi:cytoskeletal protein RodZ
LSLEEVCARSSIKQVFLVSLEQGDYHRLPPEVYVAGFLRQLAELYSLDAASLIAQYKKERDLLLEQAAVRAASEPLWRVLLSRITITPTLVTVGSAAIIILFALAYVLYQIILINGEPRLTLTEPATGQHVTNSFIRVAGMADPGTTVTVNDQQVFVGSSGAFAATIGLASGQQELVVTAKNKFNKQSTQRVVVVVDAGIPNPEVLGAVTDSIVLQVEALDAVMVSFS